MKVLGKLLHHFAGFGYFICTCFSFSAKKKCLPQHFVATSASDLNHLQQQWARVFNKLRIPFHASEDEEFKKAIEMTRPGLGSKLLTRKDLAGKHLSAEHEKIDEKMRSSLEVI